MKLRIPVNAIRGPSVISYLWPTIVFDSESTVVAIYPTKAEHCGYDHAALDFGIFCRIIL